MGEQFEPFGTEWEKEMMKHTKASLISMIRAMGKEKPSGEDAWAIYRPGTGIYYFTVTDTRACAVRAITEGWHMPWKQCKGYGVKLVRLKIQVMA